MATITLDADALLVRLSPAEKLGGLMGDVRVPLAAVRDATVEGDALAAATGLRAPGLAIPGRVKIGSWRRRGGRAVVVARRGVPAVAIGLEGVGPERLLISTPHAEAVAGALRERLGRAPAPADAPRELQVTIPSGTVSLSGTLRLPAGAGPHPAVVLVSGSGPLDRDADVAGLPLGLTRDLAVALAERGVASLRYDRRGVGGSDGDFLAAGLRDNADDLRAAFAWLAARPEVRGDRAFLLGHSEGALHAIAVAADPPVPPAGVVLLAAPAKTGEDTLVWQARQVEPGLPAPVRALLRVLRTDLGAQQAKTLRRLKASTADVARVGGRKVNARWHRELIAFDPAPALSEIGAPVLAITGDHDIQVDPADLERIAALVPGPVETVRVPQLTHILRRDPGPPSLGAYKTLIRRPIDPELVRIVVDWIAARAA